MQTLTCTLLHGCTHSHVFTHTQVHTLTCTLLHGCTHPHAHMCTHIHRCTHSHAFTPTQMHTLTCVHTYTDAHMHTPTRMHTLTCTHLHGCTHPHAHTYTDAHTHMHTPTLRCTYQALYTHMNAPPHAHMPCVQTCTHSRVCTHTLPSPGQRAGLGQTAVDRGGHCSLWFPTGAVFLAGGPGKPQNSSGSTALALEPSTCSHAFAIVRKCEGPPDALLSSLPQRGPLEPPSHTWGTPASAAAPTLAGPAPRPHGPAAPRPRGPGELPGRHRMLWAPGLLCGKQTRKQTRQQLTGHGRKRGQFGLRGPLRHPTSGLQAVDTADPPGPTLSPAPRRQDR